MKITRRQYKCTIPILEKVVREEFGNPMSVIIWPKELHMLVDDNMRKEMNKSSTGHLVLPSVVQALYSLAFVHKALGNDRAYGETMYRLKDVCEYIGEDCPLPKKLFIYALHFEKINFLQLLDLQSCLLDKIIHANWTSNQTRSFRAPSSPAHSANSGVPQGSVIGGFHFAHFISCD